MSETLRLDHFKVGDQVVVLAHLLAPLIVQPRAVKDVEAGLEERLGRAIQLVVRTSLTEGVSATGSMRQVQSQTLDGLQLGEAGEREEETQQAEQILREFLGGKVVIRLARIERPPIREELNAEVLFIETAGLRELNQTEIIEIDDLIKAVLGPDARIGLVQNKRTVTSRDGPLAWVFAPRPRASYSM